MKKILLLCILIISISSMTYALDLSVGGSFGAGIPVFRGDDSTNLLKSMESGFGDIAMNFTTKTKIDFMVEIMPYFAIETGIGYKTSSFAYEKDNAEAFLARLEIFIPIMLRAQYEYELGVAYLAAGVNLGFPAFENYYGARVSGLDDNTAKSSNFDMDISFALGQEFRLGKANYIGLRVAYDLNVVRPYATSGSLFPSDYDMFQDDFTVAVTYRYAFDSK